MVGRLRVFDKLKNLILVDSTEFWNVKRIEEPLMGTTTHIILIAPRS